MVKLTENTNSISWRTCAVYKHGLKSGTEVLGKSYQEQMFVSLCSADYFTNTNGSCTCTMGAGIPWFTKLLNTEFDKDHRVTINQPNTEKMK